MFAEKVRFPGEFFVAQKGEDEALPTREFVKSLARRVFCYHPPRKTYRLLHLNSVLFNRQVTLVFVKDDVRRYSLQPAYRGPYLIWKQSRKFFVQDYETHQNRVSIDRLKPAIFSMTSHNKKFEQVRARKQSSTKKVHLDWYQPKSSDDLDDTCSRTLPDCTNQQPPQCGGAIPNPVWVGLKWLLALPRVPVAPGTVGEPRFCHAVP